MTNQHNKPNDDNDQKNRLVLWLCLVLAAGTVACYWPTRHFKFINLDDPLFVYETHMVQRGLTWPGFIWSFKTVDGGSWNPLVWLSHMADCQFYGWKDAGGHHVTNFLLHTANVLLVFLFMQNMTGAIWRSAFMAAIFAWHPMHVESVAWVSERKDVLSTLFFLLSLCAYTGFVKTAGLRRMMFYGLTFVLFALGLMSKPMLVTLPFVLLLLDYWPLQRTESAGKLVMEKVPFLILSLAMSALTVWTQKNAGALGITMPLSVRLENAAVSYVIYLEKLFWPVHLTLFYPFPHSIPAWQVAGAVLLITAISWAAIRLTKKRRFLSVGWFWFLGTLVPVIGIIKAGMQACADRFTYIPYIGLAIAISWGLADLAQVWPRSRVALLSLAALALAGSAATTRSQIKYWRDNTTAYEHALNVTSGNWLADENLGIAMGADGKIDQAVQYLQEATRLNPLNASPYYNLGEAYAFQHRLDDAGVSYKKAVELGPNNPKALNNLAWLYATAREARLRNGAEAVRLATRACKITKRQDTGCLDTLAAAYAEAGRFEDAIKTTEEIRNLAVSDHDIGMENTALERLKLYKAGKPYRDEQQ